MELLVILIEGMIILALISKIIFDSNFKNFNGTSCTLFEFVDRYKEDHSISTEFKPDGTVQVFFCSDKITSKGLGDEKD